MENALKNPGRTLDAVRRQCPLVHNITNFVSMDLMANALLALGASPAMIHALEEAADFAHLAQAININIGTLEPDWLHAMVQVLTIANREDKPSVLDPVGVGATSYRQQSCQELLNCKPCVIRGNASEILTLEGLGDGGHGVDARHASDDAIEAAQSLSRHSGTVVVVSGARDYVCDGVQCMAIANGSPMQQQVTAMGCTLNAVIAACCAVCDSPWLAAVHGSAIFGVAAQCAAKRSQGPGSFRLALLDALSALDADIVNQFASISEEK